MRASREPGSQLISSALNKNRIQVSKKIEAQMHKQTYNLTFLTYIHLATFQSLNTIESITASSVDSSQIVTLSFAFAKSFVIK